MEKTQVSKTINKSAENVWNTISEFSGIEKFVPAIASSVSKGTGEGMQRTCTMDNGVSFNETLLKVDNNVMELMYNVHDPSPLPFSKYTATMKVNSIDSNSSELLWSCSYQVDAGTIEEAATILSGIFLSGIEGLDS